MSDTILGGLPGDLISGSDGDDTLFATADTTNAYAGDRLSNLFVYPGPPPDTDTIVLDGRLWLIVRRVGGATVVEGATRRLIEVEEV